MSDSSYNTSLDEFSQDNIDIFDSKLDPITEARLCREYKVLGRKQNGYANLVGASKAYAAYDLQYIKDTEAQIAEYKRKRNPTILDKAQKCNITQKNMRLLKEKYQKDDEFVKKSKMEQFVEESSKTGFYDKNKRGENLMKNQFLIRLNRLQAQSQNDLFLKKCQIKNKDCEHLQLLYAKVFQKDIFYGGQRVGEDDLKLESDSDPEEISKKQLQNPYGSVVKNIKYFHSLDQSRY
jgi:hypothetical protein